MTSEKLFEYYKYTLENCASNNLKLDNNLVEYYFLEEFDSNVNIFLTDECLEKLWCEGMIDEQIFNQSKSLVEKYEEIKTEEILTVDDIRTNRWWKELMEMSDKIIEAVNELNYSN